jgi:4-amino-4-deoxy-L-arabinose transferase-like glycosyltransferase
MSRLWLALVIALFCLPLFVGLGLTDVGNDEAIYSFAVDRVLEDGDWMVPKSSPNDEFAFLEKPPLKLWIVGLPIRAGLLPHNEFGLRFWDALFGAIAFLYVFAIGSRLAGPICGAAAVLLLIVHHPLLFDHGLRSNNMEGPLFLAYCGGVFHYLRWVDASRRPARLHAWAVGLYFVLGFMTKFVAVLFLPIFLLAAGLPFARVRKRLFDGWGTWAAVAVGSVALVVPWFAYAYWRFGDFLWTTILTEHVFHRLTTFLDPSHVQPWHFYLTQMNYFFGVTGSAWLTLLGFILLVVESIRRRWFEGTVVSLWLLVPLVGISAGSSKLYHYVYPFLPAAALGAGLLVALALKHSPQTLDRILGVLLQGPRISRLLERTQGSKLRPVLLGVAALAASIGAVSLVWGPIRIAVGDTVLFRSAGVLRPVLVALVFGVLGGALEAKSRVVIALLVASVLPLPAYRAMLPRLVAEQRPIRTATECLRRVRESHPEHAARGLYVDVAGPVLSHPMNYYFRRIRPWTRTESTPPDLLARLLNDPAEQRPILVGDEVYQRYMSAASTAAAARPESPPMVNFPDVSLLLPGPYGVCRADDEDSVR